MADHPTNQRPPLSPSEKTDLAKEKIARDDACLYSISEPRNIPCTVYRRSVRMNWGVTAPRPSIKAIEAKRGVIAGLSQKSALRLQFALQNSPSDWGVMATLTFRERVMDGRKTMKRFQRLLGSTTLGNLSLCWVREYQGRGAVHYHVLWPRWECERLGWLNEEHLQTVKSGKRKGTVLVRGELERIVVSAWMEAVGDESEEFAAFQWGGVVELIRDERGAAKYFASYLGKADQKTLPDDAEKGGRWWYMSPAEQPLPQGRSVCEFWPFQRLFGVVFDKAVLGTLLLSPLCSETMPAKQDILL